MYWFSLADLIRIGLKCFNPIKIQSKIYLLGVCCGICFASWSQPKTLYLQFKSSQESSLNLKTEVYNAQTFEYISKTDSGGYFKWTLKPHGQIIAQSWGYKDTLLNHLNYNSLLAGDTVVLLLRPLAENLDEVIIQAQDSWIKKKRLFAFERWGNGWCFLGKKKLFITDYKLELLYTAPLIRYGRKRVSELYKDVMNNLYLLGKDSVTQILVLNDSIHYYPTEERKKFDYLIQPMQLVVDETTLLYRDIKDDKKLYTHLFREAGSEMTFELSRPPLHNCGTRFELRAKGQKPYAVHQVIDTSAFEKADYYYGVYMARCLDFWRVAEVEGAFDPALKAEMNNARNNYRRFHAQYLSTYWFKQKNDYVLIDPFSKSCTSFNTQFEVIDQYPLDFENCPPESYILQDKATQQIWLRKRMRGLDRLYLLKDQRLNSSIDLDVFTSNIRVYNKVFYYLDQNNRFRIRSQKTL
jgi:hypothetical protein